MARTPALHARPTGRLMLAVTDGGLAVRAAFLAVINRYTAARTLASLDRRMLADVGITPEDVQSALSEPLWCDPTRRLSVLAIERRAAGRWRGRSRVEPQTDVETASVELLN